MRRLALAVVLAVSAATSAPAQAPNPAGLRIAVVGDDTLRSVVTDTSPIPCGPSPYPAPCTYEGRSPSAYTGLLNRTTRGTVSVLSELGPTDAQELTYHAVPVVLDVQLPRLSVDADVVIVNAGRSDVSAGPPAEILSRLDDLVAGIRARAPAARIVFLGLRAPARPRDARVDAWNARERELARALGGIFIDLGTADSAQEYRLFPDGLHPSRAGSESLAQRIARALALSPSGEPSAPAAALTPAAGPSLSPAAARLPLLPPRSQRMRIAVLGASMERNVVLDRSPVPCGVILRAPACTYQDRSPLAFPQRLGVLANASVLNLSVAGSQAADARTNGTIPSMLESQVPRIPPDTQVVVVEMGVNDMSISGPTDAVLHRIDRVLAALRTRVPKARIILLGLRDYGASVGPRLDAWNAHERAAADVVGAAMIDLRARFPATDYVDFPDATHTSRIGAIRVAELISATIDRLRR